MEGVFGNGGALPLSLKKSLEKRGARPKLAFRLQPVAQ
jgi:hypothetical protein